jgi:putative 4-mercaptohistidine N1-methyltranferase
MQRADSWAMIPAMTDAYETEEALDQYLLFHYASAEETLPHQGGPREALNFACRSVAEMLIDFDRAARALDLGCAVGRSAFELSKFCDDVVGVDLSERFIAAAEEIRTTGQTPYRRHEEGRFNTPLVARLPDGARPERVRFAAADAARLPEGLGTFDLIHAANLLCRLPDPAAFLAGLAGRLNPGGHLVLTTPCTWLGEFTPPERWPDKPTLEWISDHLSPSFDLLHHRQLPFLLRETARKYQWTLAEASLWKRR